MPLFDAYLAVDWSARNRPSPAAPTGDALWVAEALSAVSIGPGALDQAETAHETYWRTRHACLAHLRARLLTHLQAGRRVLIGFDFPFGYPAGFATAIGLRDGASPPWRRTWDELARLIRDDAANANNRFAVAAALNARCGGATPGPLWGCPVGLARPTLAPTSPKYPYIVTRTLALERLRWTDRAARGVQPVWKLFGTGSVGSQMLTGIPALVRLRDDPALTAASQFWPFETGFAAPSADHALSITYAEIWPSLVPGALDPSLIRDRAQVRAVVCWLAALDADGRLAALFAAPSGLPPEVRDACEPEEGWILGSGHPLARVDQTD